MIFDRLSQLEGSHAFLAPSNPSWQNYPIDDLSNIHKRFNSEYSKKTGTILHAFAEEYILLGERLTKTSGKHEVMMELLRHGIPRDTIDLQFIFPNLQAYINDAIKYDMSPEVHLAIPQEAFDLSFTIPEYLYLGKKDPWCPSYGTADCISFRNDILRIHDLKTGKCPAHMEQLIDYAALFYMQYKDKFCLDLGELNIELRIYQSNEITTFNPEPDDILKVINKNIVFGREYLARRWHNHVIKGDF